MSEHGLSSQPTYDPNRLLDAILEKLNLKNDAALSRALEVQPPVISKLRHKKLPVGASILIRMHEVTDLSIRELRDLMGDRREKFRFSDAHGKPKTADEENQGAIPSQAQAQTQAQGQNQAQGQGQGQPQGHNQS
ncbi:hypothetical protein [Noviherbaspirillum massiliense]|uniref:hypothetical protein n=1 Tax=Noviherbaspirillum massiliense TaxID=1465823 RepID=UPI00035D01C0